MQRNNYMSCSMITFTVDLNKIKQGKFIVWTRIFVMCSMSQNEYRL